MIFKNDNLDACLRLTIGAQFMSIFWLNVTDVCLEIVFQFVQYSTQNALSATLDQGMTKPELQRSRGVFNLRLAWDVCTINFDSQWLQSPLNCRYSTASQLWLSLNLMLWSFVLHCKWETVIFRKVVGILTIIIFIAQIACAPYYLLLSVPISSNTLFFNLSSLLPFIDLSLYLRKEKRILYESKCHYGSKGYTAPYNYCFAVCPSHQATIYLYLPHLISQTVTTR